MYSSSPLQWPSGGGCVQCVCVCVCVCPGGCLLNRVCVRGGGSAKYHAYLHCSKCAENSSPVVQDSTGPTAVSPEIIIMST